MYYRYVVLVSLISADEGYIVHSLDCFLGDECSGARVREKSDLSRAEYVSTSTQT